MGDKVSFLDSLLVTVFSMVVVFIVLIVIAYLIDLLKVISNKDKGSKSTPKNNNKDKINDNTEPIETNQETTSAEDNPEELVAVIAAAVAASLGLNIPDINIKSIRRVPQNINTWADMGRREQLQ